jgi:hypothetical protein
MSISYGTSIPLGNLVVYLDANNTRSWPGSGSIVYDISGRENHFTYKQAGSTTSVSISDSSFSFNGSNQYLERLDVLTVNSPYTFVSLLKPTNLSSLENSFPTYNNYHETVNAYGLWHHYNSSGALQIRHYPTTSGTSVDNTIFHNVTNGSWALSAQTWDGSTFITYKNGVQVSSYALTTGYNAGGSNRNGRIGMLANRNTANDYNYNGLIKLSMVYLRALSSVEMLQLFNAIRGRVGL